MIHLLPTINATLNALAAVLISGYVLIRNKQIARHRAMMLTAFATSCLFLVCYGVSRAGGKRALPSRVLIRTIYFSVLIPHTAGVHGALPGDHYVAARHGGEYDRHRKIARWTSPIWLFVSVTGA